MSKKLIGALIALVAIFSLLILLIAINFGGVKERAQSGQLLGGRDPFSGV